MKREKFRKLSVIVLVMYILVFFVNFIYVNVIVLRDDLEIMNVIESLVIFVINGLVPLYYFLNCDKESSNKKFLNDMLLGSSLVSLLISFINFNISIIFVLRLIQNISYLVFLYLIFYKNLVQNILFYIVIVILLVRSILNSVQYMIDFSSIPDMIFATLLGGILLVSTLFQQMYFISEEKM